MPVQRETTSAISCSVTLLRSSLNSFCSVSAAALSFFSSSGMRPYLGQVAGAPRGFHLHAHLVQRLLDAGCAGYGGLLGLPDFFQVAVFALQLPDVVLELLQSLLRGLVGFLLQRLALDLELDQPAVQLVQRLGLGIDLDADAAGGLINEINGLVRQLAVGDVAVRQLGRGDDGAVGDVHAVVHLVALLEAAQDGDGVLHRRLVHQHFLEAALERAILLDVLAVFVQRGGADAVQLAARQRRLEHVAGVHGALGLAGPDHGVDLVDEQDDLAFLLGQLGEHRLEPFLELAAVLGTGNQRAQVQRQQALVLEAFRHLAVDDAQGQALDDRRLADARLADQGRVVLGAARQHLHHAADLVVAADDGVELAGLGARGEVDAVFLQRLALVLCVGVVHALASAYLVDGFGQHGLVGAGFAQRLADGALVLRHGQHHQLAGDELVLAFLRQLVGQVEDAAELRA
jgi:hypothetical protein